MTRWKSLLLAGVTLALSAFVMSASAENRSFKANFMLQAASATVSDGELRLTNVNPVVFVVESGADSAFGVSESAVSFLKRWAMLDHEIRPQAVLFTNAERHEIVYSALRFEIDNPSQADEQPWADWVFDIDHLVAGAREHFTQGQTLESVTLTVVMEHTPLEVAEGRVCGPWDPSALKEHHELMSQ